MRRVVLPVLMLTVLVVVPLAESAARSWGVAPAAPREPSHALDSPLFMWQEPNQELAERVYFAGNRLAALDGADAGFTTEAWLGYWRDCNLDGLIQTGPYRAELLDDRRLCPPMLDGANGPGDAEHDYNDGVWVTEFHPVDDEAVVWAEDLYGLRSDAMTYEPSLKRWLGRIPWSPTEPLAFFAHTPAVPGEHLPGQGTTGSIGGLSYHLRDVE